MRTTKDNRILVGGRDEKFVSVQKRDELINEKSKLLQKDFLKKFPHIPFEIDYFWAGVFANTKDGLPFIGENELYKHGLYALNYGGNGIVFGQIAGEIISESIKGNKNKYLDIFSPSRKMAQ